MKTFNELKEGDLLLVKYYREEEFMGRPHNKICRAKNVIVRTMKKLERGEGFQKRVTFEFEDSRLEVYGKQTLDYTIGGVNDYQHVTFNAPGALEICCDPIHGIRSKKKLLMDEIQELDTLIRKVVNKCLKE